MRFLYLLVVALLVGCGSEETGFNADIEGYWQADIVVTQSDCVDTTVGLSVIRALEWYVYLGDLYDMNYYSVPYLYTSWSFSDGVLSIVDDKSITGSPYSDAYRLTFSNNDTATGTLTISSSIDGCVVVASVALTRVSLSEFNLL